MLQYLNSPEEGEAGPDGDQPPSEPYPGEEGLQALWEEVLKLCSEEDMPRLEEVRAVRGHVHVHVDRKSVV